MLNPLRLATARRSILHRLRHTRGAIDLFSIMVGVIVIGVISTGISATVFGVVPWAQDNAAQQALGAVAIAEAASRAMDGEVLSYDSHATSQYRVLEATGISRPIQRLVVDAAMDGGWVAATASASGAVFVGTSSTPTVFETVESGGQLGLPAQAIAALPAGFGESRAQAVVNAVGSGSGYDFGAAARPGFGGGAAGPGPVWPQKSTAFAQYSAYSNAGGGAYANVLFDGLASFDGSAAWVASLPGRETWGHGADPRTAELVDVTTAVSWSRQTVPITTAAGIVPGYVTFFLDAAGAVVGIQVSPEFESAPADIAAFEAMVGNEISIAFPGRAPLIISMGSISGFEYVFEDAPPGGGGGSGPVKCWSTPPQNPNPGVDDPPPPGPVEVPCP